MTTSDDDDISQQIIRCQNRVKYYERLILWCAEELIKLQQRITELREKRGKSCLLRRLTKTRSQ